MVGTRQSYILYDFISEDPLKFSKTAELATIESACLAFPAQRPSFLRGFVQ
jgi:hypothetical protein